MLIKLVFILAVGGGFTNGILDDTFNNFLSSSSENEDLNNIMKPNISAVHPEGSENDDASGLDGSVATKLIDTVLPIFGHANKSSSLDKVLDVDSLFSGSEEAKKAVDESIKEAISGIETFVENAKKQFEEWVKHYNCTSASDLVQCVTDSAILPNIGAWRKSFGEQEMPAKPPGGVEILGMDIAGSLQSTLQKWKKIFSKITGTIQPESDE